MKELITEVSRHLQEEFGVDKTVSKRTIQSDINIMRSPLPRGYNAPIVCRTGMYFYANQDFSIEKPPLKQEDLDILRETVAILRQMPGLPQIPMLDLLLKRFENGKNIPDLYPNYIQFETNTLAKGTEWIAPIYQAIVQRQVLRVLYHPFMEQAIECFFHPYLLKEWRNRWYLFGREISNGNGKANGEHKPITNAALNLENIGFMDRDDQVWNLALDRIATSEPANDMEYLPNDLFNPATWFDHIVGVTKPEGLEPVDIEIEADVMVSFYLETKPIHHSQRLLNRNGETAIFQIRLIPNFEIIFDLLAFGKHIRVLSPESFKEMVTEVRGF